MTLQLGGVVRPHDGKCHMEDLKPDSTGNIVYQHWDHLVKLIHTLYTVFSEPYALL